MRIIRLAGLVVIGLSAILVAQAQTGASAAEQELFSSVNRARRAQGLPALKWNDALATAARRHAALMAQRGAAEHGFPGEPSLSSRATQREHVLSGCRKTWFRVQESSPFRRRFCDLPTIAPICWMLIWIPSELESSSAADSYSR